MQSICRPRRIILQAADWIETSFLFLLSTFAVIN